MVAAVTASALLVLTLSTPAHAWFTPPAPHIARSFHIATTGSSVRSLAISGPIVVWVAGRGDGTRRVPRGDILGRNLATGQKLQVKTNGAVVAPLAIGGAVVAWIDCRFCRAVPGLPGYTNTVVYARNLTTGYTSQMSKAGGELSDPAVGDGTVVWIERGRVMVKGLASVRIFRVPGDRGQQAAPAISGQTVVWQEMRGGAWAIYGADLRTGRTFPVARPASPGRNLGAPVISGQIVVWTQWRPDRSVAIDGKDLVTGRRFHVTTLQAGTYNPQFGPIKSISGHVVTWEGAGMVATPEPSYSIYAQDLTTGAQFRLSRQGRMPAVSGGTIVWLSPHGATTGIDGAVLH
jgi:beta propeller repeat protein